MKKIFSGMVFLVLAIVIQQMFFNLNKVVGNPPAPLESNQLLISEKLTYLIREPRFGDVVIFQKDGNVFAGVVEYVGDKSNPKPYQVISKDGGTPWELSKNEIKTLVWYPVLKMNYVDGSKSN